MRLTISEIADAVSGTLVAPQCLSAKTTARDVVVTGLAWDSRTVAPGDMYVAFVGERVDGHDFVQAALDAGAVAVLATRQIDAPVFVIVVNDALRALSDIAAAWRQHLQGIVIGLTGSSGKTTTKNLVRDVLGFEGDVVATKANQNNELGVPATLLAATDETPAVVVEMGMRGTGQVAELCAATKPDWGLVTNVGESHIELLGSREKIACAKAELFEALEQGGIAFVNAGDDYAAFCVSHARLFERGVHVVYYGGTSDADTGDADTSDASASPEGAGRNIANIDECARVWATNVVLDSEGRPTFTLNATGFSQVGKPALDGARTCALQLLGMHNVSNACAAAAVGLSFGMSLENVVAALADATPESGRQQVLHTDYGVTVVDDSYNANPDSMRASLATFKAMDVQGRRIAVLGDMLELGDVAFECHERVGKLAANAGLDRLICVGELSRAMAASACAAGMPCECVTLCADAAEALDQVKGFVSAGDAVLAKASHSIGLKRVVEGLVA